MKDDFADFISYLYKQFLPAYGKTSHIKKIKLYVFKSLNG